MKIAIKQYLNREGWTALQTAEAIRDELKRNTGVFGSLPDTLVEKTRQAQETDWMSKEDTEGVFNRVLARIYDVADYERIWFD